MYWQIPLWIYCWNLYHLPTNESYEDAAVLPLFVLRNMQVQRRKMMSSQHRTFAFSAQKSISDLGVSSNRVHIYYRPACSALYPRYICERRDGPGRGGFLNWMLVSEVSSVRVNGAAVAFPSHSVCYCTTWNTTAGARKGEMTSRWMKHAMMNMKCFCIRKGVVLSFCRPSSFFHAFLSFFFPGRRETDCPLSAVMVRGGRMRACSEVKQKVRPVSILLYCAISCRLCILKMHCLAFGSFSFFE